MLLAFVTWSTIALCAATPLHKYPYVFLLDVGNEELEKTNTEQLRVSIPGGSLALKYPAMGEGDPISHVRVSGIDFGTDLKVNIVEGGPGYEYVVLMFMGNPKVTYDAVVTLQTLQKLPKNKVGLVNPNKITTTENSNSYEDSDANSDDKDQDSINGLNQFSKKSKEVMQSTSTFYNYAKSETADGDEDNETKNVSSEEKDDDDDDSVDEEDEEENGFSNKSYHQLPNEGKLEQSYQDERNSDENEDENEEDEDVRTKLYGGQSIDEFSEIPRAEQYRYNVNLNNADNAKPDGTYDRYQELKPHFGLGFRVYPQSFIYNRQYQSNSPYNKGDPGYEQTFNNAEIPKDSKFKDGSNNIDSDYLVAEY